MGVMQAAVSNPPPPPAEPDLRRIRALIENARFAEALECAQMALEKAPADRDLLYMVAVAQRCLHRIPDATATLSRLERIHPEYPRLYQERGRCQLAMGAATQAIEAFEQAVKMSPALVASWKSLLSLYLMSHQTAAARHAGSQLAELAKLPPEILTAHTMYADNELRDAERLLREYLLAHGPQKEAMRLLAQIGLRLDAVGDAEVLLEKVVALDPDYDAARYDYATVLLKRHKHAQAREQLDKLLRKGPSNRNYRALLASVYAGFGDHERALPLYREILLETPDDADLHLSVAHGLKSLGRTPEAIDAYRTAAAKRPRYGEAYWSLANLKTFRFGEDDVARMREDEASPELRIEDRYHLCFALGKALEDAAQYAESFSYYERGNALKKAECRYRPEPLERNARLQAAVCTRDFFASRQGFGCNSPAPIFVVGLPRSGSTLIEQILASHSQVEATMELADIPRLVQDLEARARSKSGYPGILGELGRGEFARVGEDYLSLTRMYRKGKPFFIDKMPNNFRHLGLIHLMLPNAKIIDARRAPMACCFSNFKQLFASGQQFTYSLEDIGRYYRMYVEQMTHWDQVLPRPILRVQHEDVVHDLEASVRRILDFCGLEFQQSCLDFHETQRTIHTASSEQVRQPLNRDGVDQWRRYEPWLGPLKDALGLDDTP